MAKSPLPENLILLKMIGGGAPSNGISCAGGFKYYANGFFYAALYQWSYSVGHSIMTAGGMGVVPNVI